jgi:acetaldehyde dehydrogenase / alcohol dehydrogenase
LEKVIKDVKQAQKTYAFYTQGKVDKIFKAAAKAASCERVILSMMADC